MTWETLRALVAFLLRPSKSSLNLCEGCGTSMLASILIGAKRDYSRTGGCLTEPLRAMPKLAIRGEDGTYLLV
jgi:hypothetical protein